MEELPNPFRESAAAVREAAPAAIVIFGASGDLTSRKLVPALYKLTQEHLLAPGTSIVGFARRPMTDEAFREEVRRAIAEVTPSGDAAETALRDGFVSSVFYVAGSFEDEKAYAALGKTLAT